MIKIQDYNIIKNLVEKNKIENLNVLGRIKNSKTYEIFVDNIDNPKGFIFKDDYWHVPFAEDKKSFEQILKNFNFQDEFGFCGIKKENFFLTTQTLKEYNLDWEEQCVLYYLPEDFDLKVDEILPSLNESHVDLVNTYYTYKEEGSEEYLKECILTRPSSMIADEKNNPISWALIREDNTMGVMYTLKEHRKKGLAKKITFDLIYKVKSRGDIPYVHIREDNEPSKGLARETGMIYWGDVTWFGMKKK